MSSFLIVGIILVLDQYQDSIILVLALLAMESSWKCTWNFQPYSSLSLPGKWQHLLPGVYFSLCGCLVVTLFVLLSKHAEDPTKKLIFAGGCIRRAKYVVLFLASWVCCVRLLIYRRSDGMIWGPLCMWQTTEYTKQGNVSSFMNFKWHVIVGPLRECGLRGFNFSIAVSAGPVWPDLRGLYERLQVAEELGTQVSRDLSRILEHLKNMPSATNATYSPISTGSFIIYNRVVINVARHRQFSLISWTCKTCAHVLKSLCTDVLLVAPSNTLTSCCWLS